jgi:hypothetical protein
VNIHLIFSAVFYPFLHNSKLDNWLIELNVNQLCVLLLTPLIRTTNPCVGGSNPSGRANDSKGLAKVGQPLNFCLCTSCARIHIEGSFPRLSSALTCPLSPPRPGHGALHHLFCVTARHLSAAPVTSPCGPLPPLSPPPCSQ